MMLLSQKLAEAVCIEFVPHQAANPGVLTHQDEFPVDVDKVKHEDLLLEDKLL